MYRGSSSKQASEYKLQGHKDEIEFSKIINGTTKTDSITGKTDVIDELGRKYTVKGGKKKWQIFLYGLDRFLKDIDFQNELGNLFCRCLESFPKSYEIYSKDKSICKKILLEYFLNYKKVLKDTKKMEEIFPKNNEYFLSKLRLKKNTEELKFFLTEKSNMYFFLDKAIFNRDEVDMLVIKDNSDFLVFKKKDVLNILTNVFVVENSVSGNIPTDLNIDGQKVLFKSKTNVVEIEIRNDSPIHYRQVRFNMIREKTIEILKKFTLVESINQNIIFFKT